MGFEIQPLSSRPAIVRGTIVSRPPRPQDDGSRSPSATHDVPAVPPPPRSVPSEAQMRQLRFVAMITAVRRLMNKAGTPTP